MSTTPSGVILVTGGSKGIGAGIAEALARTGNPIAVNYVRGESSAAEVVDRIIAAGGRAAAFQADISNKDVVSRPRTTSHRRTPSRAHRRGPRT